MAGLGWRVSGRTLYRIGRGSEHLLHIPPAVAFDAALYDKKREQFDSLLFYDTETKTTHTIDAAEFDVRKKPLDRGHGQQYFVPLTYWRSVQKERGPEGPRPV